jgi:hypothetical protein
LQLEVRASEQALQIEKQAALLQKQTALIAQYRSERESQLQWNATENSNHEGKYTSGHMKVESTPEFRPSRRDWNPTPATPRQHSREVSPTRSVLSMLSDRQPTQTERTTAGLKHIKIDIVALQLNQNELEWRKAVTAATAALKKPHLLESSHRAYTHAQLGQLFSDLRLEMPARFQTPVKIKTPAKQSTATQDTMPSWWTQKATEKGDTFAQLASTYTDRIIEQDLKFVVVWVTVGENNLPDIENDYDSECRTILFTHMKKSLKAYAHMTKDVVHGDCRALFNAVILQNNPEPRQLLVRCFQQLVKHEKTAAEPYQPWVTTLHNIYNALDTVDFPLAPHVRLGFMMALLGSDKRYTPILEKAQEKEWEIEKCQIHFDRHATKLNDQINPLRIPLPVSHSANAIISDPAYPNPTPESDGEQGGDAEWGETDSEGAYNYPNPTTPDGEQEGDTDPEETDNQQQHQPSAQEIAAINLQLEKALAYRNAKQTQYRTSNPKNTKRRARSYQHQPCLNYSEGRECYYDPCPYNHLIGPDEAHSPSVPVTPATAPTPAAAELNKSYSHTVNMVLSSLTWAAGSVVMIDKLLTSGVPNVTTTILSSKVVKQPNGKSPRFYSVPLPTAHLDMLHEQFAYMAETGIHEDFLKLHVVAPVEYVFNPNRVFSGTSFMYRRR